MIESKSSIPMISSCYAIAFFASFHSVPMPYTLTWSIFRRLHSGFCIHTAFLRPPFMFCMCAGVGESKKSHCPILSLLFVLDSMAFFLVLLLPVPIFWRVQLLLINGYLVGACASYCSCVGRRRNTDHVWVRRCR